MQSIRLFCLPYAGGSASIFAKWNKLLEGNINIHPIELAGRGKRYSESFYKDFDEAVLDVYNQICPYLDQEKYAILGHSMGSLIAYELSNKISEKKHQDPVHIFFSGKEAPEIIKKSEIFYDMTEEDLIRELRKLGGTSNEIFENKELLDFFIPTIRADYRILETYKYRNRKEKLNCNITVLVGKEDKIKDYEISLWSKHTCKMSNTYYFNGDHFFINTNLENVIHIINNTLSNCV